MESKSYNLHSKYYDIINYDKDYKGEAEVISSLIKKYVDKEKIKLADVGCGTGNHAIELSKKGYLVRGYDISRNMINIAKGKDAGVIFECKSFEEVDEKFDVIISLFDVINTLDGYDNLIKFLKSISSNMHKDSIFIFDAWNGVAVFRQPPEIKSKIIKKDKLRIYRKVIPRTDFLKQTCELTYDMRIYKNRNLIEHIKPKLMISFFTYLEIVRALDKSNLDIIYTFPFKQIHKNLKEDDWKMNFVCKLKE